ncbi:hypothetical protein [Chroococcidiopsis sp. SAG 2025]|uniref:hypothetical protein n=1 Tax=Chroococcidiopsis sp. SAG 2025 TaxID=171389 RepID=UPI00293716C5|nr:hypothetical protein [Chroococcidiopsis sp. SAG 2025]
MRISMNFSPRLQQEVEKWASRQGISAEEFILIAVADKINALDRQAAQKNNDLQDSEAISGESPQQPKAYRKEGILVLDVELPKNFDLNAAIDELREERIREQIDL